jgi:hypothetical protein
MTSSSLLGKGFACLQVNMPCLHDLLQLLKGLACQQHTSTSSLIGFLLHINAMSYVPYFALFSTMASQIPHNAPHILSIPPSIPTTTTIALFFIFTSHHFHLLCSSLYSSSLTLFYSITHIFL